MKLALDKLTYNVEITGSGEGIMLLHGFTSSSKTWSNLAEKLSGRYKCIIPDLIGHGKTDSPEESDLYTMDSVVEQLNSLLNELQIDRVHLLGYSMGGRLAIAFALKYPDRVNKLIIESSSPGLKTSEERQERRQQDEKLAKFILNEGIEKFVDYWETIPLFSSQKRLANKVKELIRNERLANNPLGLANSLRQMGTGSQESYWDDLKNIKSEVLFITGELDENFVKIGSEMHSLTKNSEKVVVAHCGHSIHVENSEKFGTIVSEFLSK